MFAVSLSSCSTFKETHYFKDTLAPVANYYKVQISGYSLLSSSRYISGYYDRMAIQEYFGEIGQPDKARFVPISVEGSTDQNKELVLLLSSNSDAIANSISNLVKNKATLNSVALLSNKDKIANAFTIQSERLAVENKITLFKMRIGASLPGDVTGLSDEELKQKYLQVVKNELLQLYPGISTPNSFTEIYNWLIVKRD